jgi:hypothetical protein
MAGVAGLPSDSKINGCDTKTDIENPSKGYANPHRCRTSSKRPATPEARSLIVLRGRVGAGHPSWIRLFRPCRQLRSLPNRQSHRQRIPASQACRAYAGEGWEFGEGDGRSPLMPSTPMIRIIIKTERRSMPGTPVVTSHEVIEIDAPAVAERIRSGGYNEDGTFEISQVVSVEIPRP